MKSKLFYPMPKLVLVIVVIHSFAVVSALGMYLLPFDRVANLGFMLMITIMHFDLPVQMLFWKFAWPSNDLWPNLGGDYVQGMVVTTCWFLIVGGFYWFCIGMIIELILKIKRKMKRN